MTLEIGGVQFQVLVMYKYRLPLKLNSGGTRTILIFYLNLHDFPKPRGIGALRCASGRPPAASTDASRGRIDAAPFESSAFSEKNPEPRGFEPRSPLREKRFSRPPHSATLPRLPIMLDFQNDVKRFCALMPQKDFGDVGI